MKKHRVLRVWYRFFIIPILLFLLLDRASELSVTNPDSYHSAMDRYEVAAKLSPVLKGMFEKQGFPEDTFTFSTEWVEGNLNSLFTGFINWISGKSKTLSLPLDTSELYYQLPQKIVDQEHDDPGIIGLTIRAEGGTLDLVDSTLSSDARKAVQTYSAYMSRYYKIEYLLFAVALLSLTLTPLRVKGDSREPFIKYVGMCVFEYGLVMTAIFWGSYWYFMRYVSPDLTVKLVESWQLAMYQGVFDVFKTFLNTATILCLSFSVIGGVLLKCVRRDDSRLPSPRSLSTRTSSKRQQSLL